MDGSAPILLLAAVGLAISVPAALIGTRLVKSFLFETQPNDPGTWRWPVFVLLSAAILAGYAPARRASRIDRWRLCGTSNTCPSDRNEG